MEYIVFHLKSYEFDFFKELSKLIQTPVNAYGLACITNLPDPTFAHIRHEHIKIGLLEKEIQENCFTYFGYLVSTCQR